MLYVISAGLLGDALCTLPVLSYLSREAKKKGEKIYVIHTNPNILPLCPDKDNMIIIGEAWHIGVYPNIENLEKEFRVLTASKAWEAGCVHSLHMIQAHFKYLGLPIPEKPFTVPLEYDKSQGEEYDFLISPFSRSNSPDDNKRWPYERWQIIIDRLKAKEFSVGVLGHSDCDPQPFKNVDYIFNKPIPEVCAYIGKTKRAMLSIDNGLSHLTHFIGIPHLLLYPQCLPNTWVTNTNANAKVIQNQPRNIEVEGIWKYIQNTYL